MMRTTLWLKRRRLQVASLLLLGTLVLSACRGKDKNEIEVEVRSVGLDNASNAPIVVLQDHDHKVALPIWIGPLEAQAIVMQMEGINPPRPMTHDLIKTILDGAGVEFQRVVIRELKDSTYYAQIYLHTDRQDLQVDSRPSDAIALAVRFHRPIFVATALMKGDGGIDLQRQASAASTLKVSGLTVQNLTDDLADHFDVAAGHGVIIADVDDDAPSGLQRGDIILEMDGAAVTGVGDLASRMRALQNGGPARLSVQRGGQRVRIQFAARASQTQ